MQDSLGRKAVSGTAWKFAERILGQGIATVVGIILARLLDPEHYGIIAIVQIFTTLCNVFVVTGLGESLIQKKDADDLDFSSIFFINIGLSLVLYILLFFAAPFIADFYGDEYAILIPVIRVMGLNLLFAATNSILQAKVARDFAFRKIFFVSLVGTVSSAIVGISMAYMGYGVWALVAQQMTSYLANTLMLFIALKWLPKLQISFARAKSLVLYGVNVLFSAFVNTAADEAEGLFIGKVYTPVSLSFYSKGTTYPKLLANNLSTSISTVFFTTLTKVQDDIAAVKAYASKTLKLTFFLVFPALAGLALVSKEFVVVLLTGKWLNCVPFMRLMCIYYGIMMLSTINAQCITASGDSKTYAKFTTVFRVIGLVALVCTLKFGVIWIVAAKVFVKALEYISLTFIVRKRWNYGLFQQLWDLVPNLLGVAIMAAVIIVFKLFTPDMSRLLSLIIQVLIGAASYVGTAVLIKNEQFYYFVRLLKSRVLGKK